jgi:hypothetical protein
MTASLTELLLLVLLLQFSSLTRIFNSKTFRKLKIINFFLLGRDREGLDRILTTCET